MHHESFNRLLSCIDVTRWEKPLRELGVVRISPAHFASVLPYAYLPYEPGPSRFSADRLLRPGKHLLREAFLGDIPDSVRTRKKNWGDAVISARWMKAGIGWMRAASQPFERHELYEHAIPAELLRRWDPRSPQATVTSLAFWHKIMLRRNVDLTSATEPPTWRELLA